MAQASRGPWRALLRQSPNSNLGSDEALPFNLLSAFAWVCSPRMPRTNSKTPTASTAIWTRPRPARWTGKSFRCFFRPTPFRNPSIPCSTVWIATPASRTWCMRANCRRLTVPACHEKEAKDYATSIHGLSHKLGASGAANCWDCHGVAWHSAGEGPGVAGFQAEPPANLRQMPQQSRADEGIPDEVSRGRVAIHGKHPRPRAAEDGIDRRAVLQRLPRRA